MSKEELHRNNPLQGVGLKPLLEELVTYYGFDILDAYLNMKCFRTNPSIAACAKFLKKTEWAREKVELFYLYQYKNLPAVSSEQFNVAPRERIMPEDHKPGKPAVLSIEDGERSQQKRSKNVASRNSYSGERSGLSRANNARRATQQYKSVDNERGDSRRKLDNGKRNQSVPDTSADEAGATDTAPVFNPWDHVKKK